MKNVIQFTLNTKPWVKWDLEYLCIKSYECPNHVVESILHVNAQTIVCGPV
jgi:hypothetical protein